jgi:hypothetical protein
VTAAPSPTPSHWGIITAGAVQAEQQRTLASAQATDQAVQACAAMSDGEKANWATFYAGLKTWCTTPIVNFWAPWNPDNAIVVTGDTGSTMMSYEAELAAWQQRIAGKCANAPPGLSTFNPEPAGGAPQWEKWAVVGIGFVATATIVAYVARLIPAAHERAPREPHRLPEHVQDNPLRRMCPSGSEVQTLIFPASWTPLQARQWARAHRFSGAKIDRTATSIRLRQHDPSLYRRMRTIPLGASGVKAVVGWRAC